MRYLRVFTTPRCQDVHSTYFEGITKVDGKYTRKEIEEIEEEQVQVQKEQYAERQEKKYDRLAKYSLDEENIARYKAKREAWKNRVVDINISNIKDKNQSFNKNIDKPSGNDIIKLSDKDLGVLLKYKSFESYTINDALRNARNILELLPEQQNFVKALDKALKKVETYKGNLVRTINFTMWPDCTERTHEFLTEFIEGKTVNIKEYWSTSKLENYDSDANIKIYIQNSKNGRDISLIGLDENEVLYERNTVFKVLSKVIIDSTWYILLEEV